MGLTAGATGTVTIQLATAGPSRSGLSVATAVTSRVLRSSSFQSKNAVATPAPAANATTAVSQSDAGLSQETITIIAASLGVAAALLGVVALLIVLYQRREAKQRRQSIRSRSIRQRPSSSQTFKSYARTPVVHQYVASATPSTRSLVSDYRRSRGQYMRPLQRSEPTPISAASTRPGVSRQESYERPRNDVPIIREPTVPRRARPPPALTALPARSAFTRPSTTLYRPQSGSTTTSAFAIISAAPSPAGLDRSNTMPWKSPRYPPVPRRPDSPPSDTPPLGGDTGSVSSFGLSYLVTPHTQAGRSLAGLATSPGARSDSPSIVASSIVTQPKGRQQQTHARSNSPESQKTLSSLYTARITDGGVAPLNPARPESRLMHEVPNPFSDAARVPVPTWDKPLPAVSSSLARDNSTASSSSSRTARPSDRHASVDTKHNSPGLVIEMEPGTPRAIITHARRSSLSWLKFAEKFHAQAQAQGSVV